MTANNITTGATTDAADAAAADAKARTSQLRRAIFLMVLINIVLPIVLFAVVSKYTAEVWALLLSGVPPALEAIVHVLRDRRLDVVPCAVVASICVSAGVAAATSDARLLLVKDSFLTVGFGLTFLGSMCLSNENLIWYYNRQFNGPEAKARLDAMYAYPAVKQATTTMCWVWGGGLLAEAAVRIVLIYALEVHVMAYVSPVVMAITFTALGGWNSWTRWGSRLEAPCYEATAAVLGDGWTCGKFVGDITSSTPTSSSCLPSTSSSFGLFLTDRVGFGFPILSKLTHQGPVQAIAGVLADNLDASVSVTGLEVKVAAAIVFCTQVQNAPLLDDMTTVARFVHTIDNVTMVDEEAWVKAFGQDDDVAAFAAGSVQHTLLRVARVHAASPSVMPTDLFDACIVPEVTSAHLAEMVNWLVVQQMLHHSFYDVYGN
ncbi:hypothetical protein DYB26_001425 [Aphanomyces astaci]|uniref:Uncharacterized protein n=1 Tax=Aphanomyces astaci TaxID=112090 RepID=A0A397CZX8_APHAT|nr:hypothetical protein DYB38_006218 [Aphanomyces astaci]RHY84076.1 hypothetical protein DYB26_001425 [Aphanomyces astaci]RHZ07094.1 hypothetical protein DYB31_004242 [Aphanomyces astaci]